MQFQIILTVGDSSGDGHNVRETIAIKSNLSKEDIVKATSNDQIKIILVNNIFMIFIERDSNSKPTVSSHFLP